MLKYIIVLTDAKVDIFNEFQAIMPLFFMHKVIIHTFSFDS